MVKPSFNLQQWMDEHGTAPNNQPAENSEYLPARWTQSDQHSLAQTAAEAEDEQPGGKTPPARYRSQHHNELNVTPRWLKEESEQNRMRICKICCYLSAHILDIWPHFSCCCFFLSLVRHLWFMSSSIIPPSRMKEKIRSNPHLSNKNNMQFNNIH